MSVSDEGDVLSPPLKKKSSLKKKKMDFQRKQNNISFETSVDFDVNIYYSNQNRVHYIRILDLQ